MCYNPQPMKLLPSWTAKELRLLSLKLESAGDGDILEPLGGWQRTQESTFGAVGNIVGGTGQLITGNGQGGRIGGVARVGQGALDVLDIPVSLAADGIRNVAGTPSNPHSSSRFNITRAAKSFTDIRTDDPMNAIKDAVVFTTDNIHALFFKAGSDALKAVRGSLN